MWEETSPRIDRPGAMRIRVVATMAHDAVFRKERDTAAYVREYC